MLFDAKVAIVTGGTSGVGRAVVRRLAGAGARVIAIGRNAADGAALEGEPAGPGEIRFQACDVGRSEDIAAAVAEAAARFGRVDVLVSNAATMTFAPVADLAEDDWDRVLAVNLKAAFLLTRYALAHMGAGSSIVAVSSVHAIATTAGVAPYAASKGGLEALMRALAVELAPRGIRANAVRLGAIDTPMLWGNPNVRSGAEQIDRASVGSPDEAAAAIVWLASPEARFVTGAVLSADGGRLARLG